MQETVIEGTVNEIRKENGKYGEYYKLVIDNRYYNYFPKDGVNKVANISEGCVVKMKYATNERNGKIFNTVNEIETIGKSKIPIPDKEDRFDRGMAFNNAATVIAAIVGLAKDTEEAKELVSNLCDATGSGDEKSYWSRLEDHLYERYKSKR